MKKSILFGVLFIFIMLLISCGKSPQEKLLVGEWEIYNQGKRVGVITFDSDGTGTTVYGGGNTWKLELVDSDALVLKIYEDDELEEENTVNFKTNDELEIIDDGQIVALLKRKVVLKKGKKSSGKLVFEGEWEANRSQLTITKNSTDTFLVSFNDGGFEAGTFIADLDGDVLVGRGGRFSGLILLLEDNGETLVVGEYRYNKINN